MSIVLPSVDPSRVAEIVAELARAAEELALFLAATSPTWLLLLREAGGP